jgi:adenylate cyclase class 2
MPLEIEAKMRVSDLAEVRRRLRAASAHADGELLEINRYFDTPDQALLSRDSGLRVRTTASMWQTQTRHVVTYKGPRQAGELKRREEIEFEVSDADLAGQLLTNLGYQPELSFEKRRETWSLGGCEVVLDELPLIGSFVEIEGPSIDAIESVRRSLGLGDAPLVSDSYIALLVAACRQRGIRDRFIRFPDSPQG